MSSDNIDDIPTDNVEISDETSPKPVDVVEHNKEHIIENVERIEEPFTTGDVVEHNKEHIIEPVDIVEHNKEHIIEPIDIVEHNKEHIIDPVDIVEHNKEHIIENVEPTDTVVEPTTETTAPATSTEVSFPTFNLDFLTKVSVLIVGATGKLGSSITRVALKNPRLQVNVLVRDPTKNKELVGEVETAGGKVITGDLSQPETLEGVTKGIHTVISAVGGFDENVTVDGQIALFDDAVKNGVRRFVPSDFGVDYTLISRDELLASPITSFKVKFEDYFKDKGIPLLRFYTGCLTEMFMYILSQNHSYWGDVDLSHDVTSYENTARFVVSAVTISSLSGKLNYSGGKYTIKEIQDTYNSVRETDIELKNAGTLKELRELIETKRSEGDEEAAGFLALYSVIYDHRSKFISTDNKAFSDVKASSFEEFLRENPEVTL